MYRSKRITLDAPLKRSAIYFSDIDATKGNGKSQTKEYLPLISVQ